MEQANGARAEMEAPFAAHLQCWAELMPFSKTWRLRPEPGYTPVVEFVFAGVHYYTDGPGMQEYVRSVLQQQPVRAVVLDLADYTYESGNDLFGLFVTGVDWKTHEIRPLCVVAHGKTRRALESLWAAGNMQDACDVTFAETQDAVREWMRSRRLEGSA